MLVFKDFIQGCYVLPFWGLSSQRRPYKAQHNPKAFYSMVFVLKNLVLCVLRASTQNGTTQDVLRLLGGSL